MSNAPEPIGEMDLMLYRMQALLREDTTIAAHWGMAMHHLMALIGRLETEHGYNSEEVCAVVLEIQSAAMCNVAKQRDSNAQ